MRDFHLNPDEKLAKSSSQTLKAIGDHAKKTDETNKSIRDLNETVKDKQVEILGFSGVVKSVNKNTKSIEELKGHIDDPKKVITKLDEIKSASLITNATLKKIVDKKPSELPQKMKVELEGAEIVTIKGKDGKKGEKGDKGDKGNDGLKGDTGKEGRSGQNGIDGKDGKDGRNGTNGKDGRDGVDGLDAPEIDMEEVKDVILKEVLKKLPKKETEDTMNQRGYQSTGGSNAIVIKNNGTRVTDFYTEIDFTTNLTATYSNGKITISASGGSSSSFTPIQTLDNPDKSRTDFRCAVTAHAQPTFMLSDGLILPATAASGTTNWTWNSVTDTVTMIVPPDDSLYNIT